MRIPLSEYTAVETAVNTLGEANISCDFDCCRELFHDKAFIAGYVGGTVIPGSVKELETAIESQGLLPNFRNRMDILAMDDGIAVVRVPEEEVVGKCYVNYLTMAKAGGEWKCIAMVYTQS